MAFLIPGPLGRARLHRESGAQGRERRRCPPGHLGRLPGGDVLGVSPVSWQLPSRIVADSAERTEMNTLGFWLGACLGFFPHFPVLEQFGWDEFSSLSAAGLVERHGLLLGKSNLKTYASFSSLMTTSELCAAFHLPVPQFPHVYKGRVEERKAGLHQGGLGCVFSCVRASSGRRLPRGQEWFWVRPKGG